MKAGQRTAVPGDIAILSRGERVEVLGRNRSGYAVRLTGDTMAYQEPFTVSVKEVLAGLQGGR